MSTREVLVGKPEVPIGEYTCRLCGQKVEIAYDVGLAPRPHSGERQKPLSCSQSKHDYALLLGGGLAKLRSVQYFTLTSSLSRGCVNQGRPFAEVRPNPLLRLQKQVVNLACNFLIRRCIADLLALRATVLLLLSRLRIPLRQAEVAIGKTVERRCVFGKRHSENTQVLFVFPAVDAEVVASGFQGRNDVFSRHCLTLGFEDLSNHSSQGSWPQTPARVDVCDAPREMKIAKIHELFDVSR